jgi:hypothetical protein
MNARDEILQSVRAALRDTDATARSDCRSAGQGHLRRGGAGWHGGTWLTLVPHHHLCVVHADQIVT